MSDTTDGDGTTPSGRPTPGPATGGQQPSGRVRLTSVGAVTPAMSPRRSIEELAEKHAGPAAVTSPGRGLFEPDSVTWRVHSDPLMGIAGLRGLFLHALHPVTMAAVDEYASETWDPWTRLARTAVYVGVTTFGTASDAILAGSRVRAVHARVYGTTRQGRPYTADDPNLLVWVHNCLVASFLEIVTRGGLALTAQEQDLYIAEQVRSAMLVGLEPDEVPRDRASLVRYFREIRPALGAGEQARRAVTLAVAPTLGAPPVQPPGSGPRPVWADVAGLALATLPPWARRMYGLTELTEAASLGVAAATLALRSLRTSLAGLPWAVQPRRTAVSPAPSP